jgi:hypothetical protein
VSILQYTIMSCHVMATTTAWSTPPTREGVGGWGSLPKFAPPAFVRVIVL